MDTYMTETDTFCEDCAPEGAECIGSDREADYPDHCENCGVPLENSLTSEGVDYVIEQAKEKALEVFRGQNHTIGKELPWYEGCKHSRIVLDWLQQIARYGLEEPQDRQVDKLTVYLEGASK